VKKTKESIQPKNHAPRVEVNDKVQHFLDR